MLDCAMRFVLFFLVFVLILILIMVLFRLGFLLDCIETRRQFGQPVAAFTLGKDKHAILRAFRARQISAMSVFFFVFILIAFFLMFGGVGFQFGVTMFDADQTAPFAALQCRLTAQVQRVLVKGGGGFAALKFGLLVTGDSHISTQAGERADGLTMRQPRMHGLPLKIDADLFLFMLFACVFVAFFFMRMARHAVIHLKAVQHQDQFCCAIAELTGNSKAATFILCAFCILRRVGRNFRFLGLQLPHAFGMGRDTHIIGILREGR